MKNKDVAIVGMSCFAPGAENIHQYWDNLVNGVDSIIDAPAHRIDPRYFGEGEGPDRFYCKKGGFAPDILFDPLKYSILPVAVEGMDSTHLLILRCVYEALTDAGVFEKKIALDKCAFILGKGNYAGGAIWRALNVVHVGEQMVDILKTVRPDLSQEELTQIKKAYQVACGRYQADSMPGLIPNLITSLVSNKLDMTGPSYTVDAACASSLIALDQAINELQSGRCDIAIAGGVHTGHNAPFWSIFTQLGALSRKQSLTPFSENADGLVIGEGAGLVVVKLLDKAIADNDRIYAVIKGIGVSSDGSGTSVLAPSAKGQKLAIKEAWVKSGLDPHKIGFVETHGTGTVVGDQVELDSLIESFPVGEGGGQTLIGAVKSSIGHTMPAAGVLALIKTTLALYHRKIPATLHCDQPLKKMKDTRFSMAKELTEWDEKKYPLVAGVNAFGFGGINSHVILEAYGEKVLDNADKANRKKFADKVIVLTAPTKEALIKALREKNLIQTGKENDYRLVLFNPTPERIEKTIKLIEKDLIWKGRQDIWFTNKPLIKEGGKVAFLYAGYDPESNPELKSLFEYFDFFMPEDIDKKDGDNEHFNNSAKLFRCAEAVNYALNRLNIKPDMNAGHSLGEWFGVHASGMVEDGSISKLIQALDPEDMKISNAHFVAVGCGQERVQEYLDSIPNLYLANDNCTNQVLLCGTKEAVDKLILELKKEQIFYQLLAFQSGFHTPFTKEKLYILEQNFSHLTFFEPKIPMWSSTTLEVYPSDTKAIKELSIKHLMERVRFRELIEKLYDQEKTRIFVQVGVGSLVGFVDDTLAKKNYSAISTCSNSRTTLEQLRRVLALLFIEGKNVDLDFIGVNSSDEDFKLTPKGMSLEVKMKIYGENELPFLKKISEERPKNPDLNSLFTGTDNGNPIMAALNQSMSEMASMQSEMVKLFQERGMANTDRSIPTSDRASQPRAEGILPVERITDVKKDRTGETFEENLFVSMDTHPAIIGHSLVKQPKHWTCVEDLNPVIPMTMTVELLGEAGHKQDLNKKIARIGEVSVLQWMEVHNPFKQKIYGTWKSEELLSVGIKNFATGEVTLKDDFPAYDPIYDEEIDLGENITYLPTTEQVYENYMFHGETYQGIEKVANVTAKGIRTYIRKGDGKGSLLDNIGQSYGLYIHLTLKENFITFPVKIEEINFYQDMDDQEGLFECVCLNKGIGDQFTFSEMIIKRDGKIWCIIKGWQNRRFEFDEKLWQITLNPRRNLLAEELAPNVFFFYNKYNKGSIWSFLRKRYLNLPEKRHYDSMMLNKRNHFLISRIALKDSLRSYIQNKWDFATFPIEFGIEYDAKGKPSVMSDIKETKGLQISIAHKGGDAVSIVSDKPVGIDIESIEERSGGFIDLSFTVDEQKLLKGKDLAEWTTRFWVAKEAYSKMIGTGLQGNPKRYEVKAVLGDDRVLIEDCEVKMIKHNNLIIGWTL